MSEILTSMIVFSLFGLVIVTSSGLTAIASVLEEMNRIAKERKQS